MKDGVHKLKVFLKSGNTFEVTVKSWKVTRSTTTDWEFAWESLESSSRMIKLDLGSVEAILEVR